MKIIRLIFAIFLFAQVYCDPCTINESLNITAGVSYPNGSILYNDLEFISGTWYEENGNNSVTVYGCPCKVLVCLWKCCGQGQMYLNRSCANSGLVEVNPFNPTLYKGTQAVNVSAIQQFFYMYIPDFEKYLVDSNSQLEEIYIQENGTLYEISSNRPQWHPSSTYCVDMMLDSSSQEPRLVAGVRYPEEDNTEDSSILYIAYGIGLILSVPFLLATFLVYAFIPELRNLHGMCLMAYTGGLILAYTLLAYLKLHTGKIGVAMTGCYIVAFLVYYAFQSSFFWLNIMCFDIWRTFRSGYRSSSNKRHDNKRFALYGLYAWGIPMLLTVLTVFMQFTEFSNGIITPGFGSRRCWFVDWLSELVYFFTPVFILVVCNVIFFSVTAYRIRSIRQETAILKGAESARSDRLNKDKQRYSLYLKLFVVMGVNWTVEVISFAVGGSNWYWVVVDIANIGLGFYVFFVFVWKKKVRNLVAKRWRSVRGVSADSGPWATRSSSAPTEDTRVSADESAIRLKEMH